MRSESCAAHQLMMPMADADGGCWYCARVDWWAPMPRLPVWNLAPRPNQDVPWECSWHGPRSAGPRS
jgi:hypothetical protein